jgi:hypothetical protein
MKNFTWQDQFLTLFDKCLAQYRRGNQDYTSYYSAQDLDFLRSIGYRPREFFDFIEDFADGAPLPPAAALLVAAVRRDYLHEVQNGMPGEGMIPRTELPARGDTSIGGVPYLARITAKARCKLRGELDPEIMFSCGGDRAFLQEYDIHPADFLRAVWLAGDDDGKVLGFVREAASNLR